MSRYPCVRAARRFDPARHLPFVIAGVRAGWIRRSDLPWLDAWREIFEIDDVQVGLHAGLDTVEARSRALGEVIEALAADGRIRGWRNETYAIRNRFDAAPLALIERAASRFFGTQTYAVHLNGVVGTHAMWIARRSPNKATDPGMLDNLVGGGIGWGYGIDETLVKECWEESGLPAALARRAVRGGTIHVLQEIDEGTQAEQLFIYDLDVGADFVPRNQDGEVADHRLASIDTVLDWLADGAMTVDASLAALDWMARHGALDAAERTALATLGAPPAIAEPASEGEAGLAGRPADLTPGAAR
ncbi:NUDIX hydrolase [Pararobbsia silviterrae]|uniref:NUDIX hydrolase n=1 Tax=Pararobbsia silviterrae TaxID=1792498 RepID=UPI001F0C7C8B|nr:DUF4743 domain-containing protein [Pararobbsia silviterrae]